MSSVIIKISAVALSLCLVFASVNFRTMASTAEPAAPTTLPEEIQALPPQIQPGGEFIPGGVRSFAGSSKNAQEISPGVIYYTLEGQNWKKKPLHGYVVEVDPSLTLMELRVATGQDTLGKKETLSSIAARHGAVAAVNAGFFDSSTGWPLGHFMQDGRLLNSWNILRTSVGLTDQKKAVLGYFAPQVTAQLGDTVLSIEGVNYPAAENKIILYTPFFSSDVKIPSGGIGIVIAPDENGILSVSSMTTEENAVPSNGYVLTLRDDKKSLTANLDPGSAVKIKIDYDQQWKGLKHLVTAGPLLVDDGQPVFDAILEGFRGSILEPAARTAVGINKEGKIILAVVDGKKDWSAGLTLEELAYLMTDLGCIKAAAMDGGGSSGMWVKESLVSVPTDGKERTIANAILVLYQAPVYLDNQRIFFDVPPLFEKGRVLVPLRKIFDSLQAKISWDQDTKTVTATKDNKTVVLTVGEQNALIDGKVYYLDVPACIKDGRIMVPLRFVSSSLGANVKWSSKPPAVFITSNAG
ncbi:MAG: phosphodiester glycosidase family protein [Eubacteriales bacterium]|jgi:uncharacterized protein YigE (DUF2233 family)